MSVQLTTDRWRGLGLHHQGSDNIEIIELGEELGDRDTGQVTCSVTSGRKCSSAHAVDVERSRKVVDLVLEDPRVPTACVDGDRCAVMVERLDLNRTRA